MISIIVFKTDFSWLNNHIIEIVESYFYRGSGLKNSI